MQNVFISLLSPHLLPSNCFFSIKVTGTRFFCEVSKIFFSGTLLSQSQCLSFKYNMALHLRNGGLSTFSPLNARLATASRNISNFLLNKCEWECKKILRIKKYILLSLHNTAVKCTWVKAEINNSRVKRKNLSQRWQMLLFCEHRNTHLCSVSLLMCPWKDSDVI